MLEFLKANKKQIFWMFRLLLVVFGILASIPVFLTFSEGGPIIILYAGSVVFSITFFCMLLMVTLGLIEHFQEQKFFNSLPYRLIKEKSHTIEYVFLSKYYFSKRHYFFSIDGDEYEAVFYSDVVKTGYGNSLAITKKIPGTVEIAEHWIAYKEQRLDEIGLINELKKITPHESRFILRNV